ncbi:MAG TPA: hypothetical protein VFG14_13910 [Chthoniobacteraceae bacterium]|nr:hypothetical protein [Chthoniobacteraceae bacterium]
MRPHPSLPAILILLLGFTACTESNLAKVERTKYARVGFRQHVDRPDSPIYADSTSVVTGSVGGAFGLAGALVATAVEVSRTAGPRDKGKSLVRAGKIDPAKSLSVHFRKEVEALGFFDTKSNNPDATFKLEIRYWGFGPGGGDNLNAVVSGEAQLVTPSGKVIWERDGLAEGDTEHTMEQYVADPRLFEKSIDEATAKLAKRLTDLD